MLSYDGKVAIVTGAGAGLGKAYALALSARGAKIVVNDFSKAAADSAVAEIKAAGGVAVANYDSVEFGEKIVQTALDTYGGVHIIINNAGVLRDVSFNRMKRSDWDTIMTVHVNGPFSIVKAAWSTMREQQYGRIVNITSTNGLYGQFGQVNYSTAKSAMLGFTKSLALEGASKNIKCNVVAPGAGTAMTATIMPEEVVKAWKPEYVTPIVCYLAHEDVPCSGLIFESGGGWTAQVKQQRAEGQYFDIDKPFGPEVMTDIFKDVCDFSRNTNPNVDYDYHNDKDPTNNPQLSRILAKL
jgi:NAD(P)-dependent dehydrogenase (short-subunit alcohol dehydrogenase family)